MTKRFTSLIILAFIQTSLCLSLASAEQLAFKGEYLVKVKNHFAANSTEFRSQSLGLDIKDSLDADLLLVKDSTQFSKSSFSSESTLTLVDPQNKFCKDLLLTGRYDYCEPNYLLSAATNSNTPNDPNLSDLWGIGNSYSGSTHAQAAWSSAKGSSNVIVAIIDTGIDYKHPDLKDNIFKNTSEIPDNGKDDDGNGYIDDYYGFNTVTNKGSGLDDQGHGTHVAGTIGAMANNGAGIIGINWHVRMLPVKFLDSSGSGSLSNAVKAIKYVTQLKITKNLNIVLSNNSWGGGGYSQSLFNAISEANQAGILFVAAAGNESNNNDENPAYPASYDVDNVISVAAHDKSGNLASFSNFGENSVDISAPGVSILSTLPNSKYGFYSGTSMATPHVSGALALLASHSSGLTIAQLKTRLFESGEALPTLSGLVRTGRILRIDRLISNSTDPLPEPSPTPTPVKYDISKITYAPRDVTSHPVTLQADELSYVNVELPRSFKFFGKEITSLSVSPNGVLYKTAPISFDYNVIAGQVPSYSIAPLHADLDSQGENLGIRVVSLPDEAKLIVRWDASLYGARDLGVITVQSEIDLETGIIDFFYATDSGDILSYLNGHSSVGIGETASNQYLYTDGLYSHLALRLTPPQSQSTTRPQFSMYVYGAKTKRKLVANKIYRNKPFYLQFENSDTSSTTILSVSAKLASGHSCGEIFLGDVSDNTFTLVGKVKRRIGKRKSGVTFTYNSGAEKTAAIVDSPKGKKAKRRSLRKASSKQSELWCQELRNSLAPSTS